MKTSQDLQNDLQTLRQALQDANQLAAQRTSNSYRVQSVTQAVVLGQLGQSELIAAQNALDASTAALIQAQNLSQATAELEQEVIYAQGRERQSLCHSINDEYSATYARYVADSKRLLQTFCQLHQLSNRHQALTNRPLMAPDQSLLCLPACHRPGDDIHNFPTGVQVLNGSIK